jgi:hypothetical protein
MLADAIQQPTQDMVSEDRLIITDNLSTRFEAVVERGKERLNCKSFRLQIFLAKLPDKRVHGLARSKRLVTEAIAECREDEKEDRKHKSGVEICLGN